MIKLIGYFTIFSMIAIAIYSTHKDRYDKAYNSDKGSKHGPSILKKINWPNSNSEK